MSTDPPTPLHYQTPLRRRPTQWVILGLLFAVICITLWWLIVPRTNVDRPETNRVRCQSNLRLLGQAILMYANDNCGRYPDHIEKLLVEEIIPDVFVCPSSNDTPAVVRPTTQATGANLISGGHLSYIYVGSTFTTSVSDNAIVAYEPLSNHGGDGSNVLFGDGHAEFFQPPMMTKLLAELSAGQNPPRAEKLK